MYKCLCGKVYDENSVKRKSFVVEEVVPLYDYDDLTPSCLIEYETKLRFVTRYICAECGKVIQESKGILFDKR